MEQIENELREILYAYNWEFDTSKTRESILSTFNNCLNKFNYRYDVYFNLNTLNVKIYDEQSEYTNVFILQNPIKNIKIVNRPQFFKIKFNNEKTKEVLDRINLKVCYVCISGPTFEAEITPLQSIGLEELPINKKGIMEFVGYSKIDSNPIFKSFRTFNENGRIEDTNDIDTFPHNVAIMDIINENNGINISYNGKDMEYLVFGEGVECTLLSDLSIHI